MNSAPNSKAVPIRQPHKPAPFLLDERSSYCPTISRCGLMEVASNPVTIRRLEILSSCQITTFPIFSHERVQRPAARQVTKKVTQSNQPAAGSLGTFEKWICSIGHSAGST